MADIEPAPYGQPPTRNVRVSQNAIYALIAAGLMLYFGYPPSSWSVPPDSSAGYKLAAWTFVYTLVIGGVAMGLTGVLLFSGQPVALAVDAVVGGVIGLLLVCCGIVMGLGGDSSGFLYLIFGVMFGASARNAWADYQVLRRVAGGPHPVVRDDEEPTG